MASTSWIDDDTGFWEQASRWSDNGALVPPQRIRTGSVVTGEVTHVETIQVEDEMADRKDANVVTLDKDNYSRWRYEVEAALRGLRLWQYAIGRVAEVQDPGETATESAYKTYLDWDEKDSKARTVIVRSLDNVTFNHVSDCKTSKQTLDRIRELRDPKSTDVLMSSITAYYAESWKQDDDVSSFMARLATHVNNVNGCEDAEVKLVDKLVIGKTLMSLPEKFANFVQSWNLISTSTTTMTQFREKLLAAERAMVQAKPETTEAGDALHASNSRQDNRMRGRQRRKPKPGSCNYCHKAGHWAKECRKRIADEKNGKANKTADEDSNCLTTQIAYTFSRSKVRKTTIIADSGASRHMTGNRSWFRSLRRIEPELILRTPDGEMQATHEGDINIETSLDGKQWTKRTWKDVLYVPSLHVTLFSTTYTEKFGCGFRHIRGRMWITKGDEPLVGGTRIGASYAPYIRIIELQHNAMAAQTIDVWHQRLGHVSADIVKQMADNGCVEGIDIVGSKQSGTCDACHFGKQTRNVHRSRDQQRECEPGQRFHSDVCYATCTSLGGNTMFVTLKDEASGYRLIRFLQTRSQVTDALRSMLQQAEKETGRNAITVRTDNGTEYTNQDVRQLLHGIHELSPPYVKEGNGIAERENRILCDTARCMLHHTRLEPEQRQRLWAEAVNTAAYIRNRLPNTRTGSKATPYELWFGRKPDVSHLRVFGSAAFVHNHDPKRKKFDARSRKGIFVGYDTNTDKVVKVYDPETRKIERVSDVQIEERVSINTDPFVYRNENTNKRTHIELEAELDSNNDEACDSEEEHAPETEEFYDADDDIFDLEYDQKPAADEQPVIEKRGRGRPLGSKNKPKEKPEPHSMQTRTKLATQTAMHVALDPQSYDEAVSRDDAVEWRKAMDEEMTSLENNETWSLVKRPANRNIVTTKWVYKSKTKPDGTLERRKARLVARGFSQSQGVDYFETFSPVVRYESVRCVLALAAAEDMEIRQFDVKTAFLNGKLNEEVYIEQPEGYEDNTDRVCRLNRSLYGLKQSPRVWNEKFNEFMVENRFRSIPEDTCVFIRKDGKDKTIVCLYVDDGLICGNNSSLVKRFIDKLRKRFDVKVNQPDCYVGMEIKRNRNEQTISIAQSGYISRVLERFGMTNAKPLMTPMDSTIRLDVSDSKVVDVPYRVAIGCLNYISQITRPDITHAVNTLARYSSNPKAVHWKAVKRLLAYIKGTTEFSIVYGSSTPTLELIGHCDSDWGGEPEQRRSTSGYVFTMNGGPVAWNSKLQKTTALSATEAEYMALTEALTECLWLRPFLNSIGISTNGPTVIKADNRAAIALSKNPEYHKRTKHVGIRYHRIRQEQDAKVVSIEYVPTDDNLADIFTKAVPSKTITHCLRQLNMIE